MEIPVDTPHQHSSAPSLAGRHLLLEDARAPRARESTETRPRARHLAPGPALEDEAPAEPTGDGAAWVMHWFSEDELEVPKTEEQVADPLAHYRRSASAHPTLSADEARLLARHIYKGHKAVQRLAADPAAQDRSALEFRALRGCRAQERIVHAHLRLVIAIVRQYQVPEEHLSDVLQHGNLGLLEVVSSHDFKAFEAHYQLFKDRATRGIREEIKNSEWWQDRPVAPFNDSDDRNTIRFGVHLEEMWHARITRFVGRELAPT